MAPFTLTALTETFLVLMNTPLVEQEIDKTPRDVPLTDMPRKSSEHYRERERERDNRRRFDSSSMSSNSQSNSSNSSLSGSSDGHDTPMPVPGIHTLFSRPDVSVDSDSLADALNTRLSSDATVSRYTSRRFTPPDFAALSSKELPPLPTHRGSRVHFADPPSSSQ